MITNIRKSRFLKLVWGSTATVAAWDILLLSNFIGGFTVISKKPFLQVHGREF
jgi:hypothetical protein